MGLILFNCDLGENESDELTRELLRSVDAASISCGVHAGSPAKTRQTLEVSSDLGLLIGAHPGLGSEGGRGAWLPDARGFREIVESQLLDFMKMADACDAQVSYVKLHGSLYHAVERDEALAGTYLELLHAIGTGFDVMAMAGGVFQEKAKAAGLRVYEEVFADRAYTKDGALVPRDRPGAVLAPQQTMKRFESWLEHGQIETVDGGPVALQFDSLCVHSDSPQPEMLLRQMRELIG